MLTFFRMKWIKLTKTKTWFYLIVGNLFCFNIENPLATYNKVKGIFKPLKWKFYYGNSPITYYNQIGKILQVNIQDVGWKDKWNTPRFEESPFIMIILFNKFKFTWVLEVSNFKGQLDFYWEQILWYLHYYRNTSYGKLDAPDLESAKKSWPWSNLDGTSSWNDEYLV